MLSPQLPFAAPTPAVPSEGDPFAVREHNDDETAWGCESANPALQIESWREAFGKLRQELN
jgi:hypothetical protein